MLINNKTRKERKATITNNELLLYKSIFPQSKRGLIRSINFQHKTFFKLTQVLFLK